MNTPTEGAPPATHRSRTRRTLLLIALVGLSPVIASYLAYYFWPRQAQVNYGKLIATPAPAIAGTTLTGQNFQLFDHKGKWVVLWAAPSACPRDCASALYATRQARTMQNAEQDRVVRVWLLTDDGKPSADLLAAHPGLIVVEGAASQVDLLPARSTSVYLIDPLNNIVLAWPLDPDIKALAKDLTRLLRASQIG
jgi:hypothetical protein